MNYYVYYMVLDNGFNQFKYFETEQEREEWIISMKEASEFDTSIFNVIEKGAM